MHVYRTVVGKHVDSDLSEIEDGVIIGRYIEAGNRILTELDDIKNEMSRNQPDD